MPTPPSEEPLLKVTLNLFASDVESFRRRYGQGWSTQIRDLVRRNVREHRIYQEKMKGPSLVK